METEGEPRRAWKGERRDRERRLESPTEPMERKALEARRQPRLEAGLQRLPPREKRSGQRPEVE